MRHLTRPDKQRQPEPDSAHREKGMLIGLLGTWRRAHWRSDSLIYLLFAIFMIVTAILWAHASHRAYLDVYLIVFSVGAPLDTGSPDHERSLCQVPVGVSPGNGR
jgi:hypothetical protein